MLLLIKKKKKKIQLQFVPQWNLYISLIGYQVDWKNIFLGIKYLFWNYLCCNDYDIKLYIRSENSSTATFTQSMKTIREYLNSSYTRFIENTLVVLF